VYTTGRTYAEEGNSGLVWDLFLRAVDILGLILLIAIFPIPFFWFLIHPAISFWRRVGTRPYLIALPVWGGLGTLLVSEQRWVFAGRIPRSAWMWAVGAGLFFLAIWLEIKRRRTFSPQLLLGIPELKPGHPAGALIRSGVYGYVRHPRYLECMMTLLAFAALTGSVGYFSLAILSVLLYQMVEARRLPTIFHGSTNVSTGRQTAKGLPLTGTLWHLMMTE